MPKVSVRFTQFFLVLMLASLACTFPQPHVTPTPAAEPPNATLASTEPALVTVAPTDTPTLEPTSTSTSTPTIVPFTATVQILGCEGYKDSYACAQAGCLWSKAGDRCRNKTTYCATYTSPTSCANAGCKWSNKFKSCS